MRTIEVRRIGVLPYGEALELQGDCLTGVWAGVAEERLGPVPGGFWSQLVWSWRNAVEGFFARLTRRRLKRGTFPSLVALQEAINRFIEDRLPVIMLADVGNLGERHSLIRAQDGRR